MFNRRINVKSTAELESVLGYKFEKKDLLRQALTHASAISERHPMAFDCDLSPVAFVGDAVLKYAVARYLFFNGLDRVNRSRAELHDGAQKIITNRVLATIAREQLHLEEYLIRGNNNQTLNNNMYADCMEAIFGAIALDCGSNQQEVIFRVVERLCSPSIENLLRQPPQTRMASFIDNDEAEWMNANNIIWPRMELESALRDCRTIAPPPQRRSCLETLGCVCLWIFAVFGFIIFCCIVVNVLIAYYEKITAKRPWYEF